MNFRRRDSLSETTECIFTIREFFSEGNTAFGKEGDAKEKIKSALKYQIIQATLAKNNCLFSIRYLCMLASVFRSECYAWIKNSDNRTRKEVRDKEDYHLILQAYKFKNRYKSARGIKMVLF